VLAGFALLYVLCLRPWRPRRFWRSLSPSVDLLFLSGLLLGALALYEPRPFDRAARLLIGQTELPASLDAVDREIRELSDSPRRLWIDLLGRIGLPSFAPEAPVPYDRARDGRLQQSVLPAVNALVSALLRCFVYAGSLLVVAGSLVLRLFVHWRAGDPAQSPAAQRSRLEDRVRELEESVAALQTRSR
jgi:hypothetical protein